MYKLWLLTKYDQTGASSRYRTYQYLPYLTDIDYTVSPLLTREYLHNRFSRSRLIQSWFMVKVYFTRIWHIFNRAHQYDLLVVEYELLPYFPTWLEEYLHWRNIPYIVDYDDALFHQYDRHKNSLVRKWLGSKIARVMRLSRHMIAGNAYLADYAKQAGARQISIIPTVIDLENYRQADQFKKADIFTIVWIGSPSTTPYLQEVLPALQALNEQYTFRLRLIGSGEIDLPGINVEYLAWQQDKEVEYISQCHVGIMPLPDTPWTRGKCGFKLIQYMACGLPVIASPVGVNTAIIRSDNGFLASSTKGWLCAFTKLYFQPSLIHSMGLAGRKQVEQEYCIQMTHKKYIGALEATQKNTPNGIA